MRKSKIISIIAGLFLAMILTACQSDNHQVQTNTQSTRSGTLSLDINNQAQPRLLGPGVDLNPSNFHIIGVGPSGSSFDINVANDDPVQIDFLQLGAWTVTVEASNTQGYVFARGSQAVDINVGETTDASINVTMLAGTGSLSLDIEWPNEQVSNPVLTGILRSDTQADIPLTFSPGAAKSGFNTQQIQLSDSVSAGYYSLIITVYDEGQSGSQNHLAMGVAETVRILEGQLTSGTFVLTGTPGLGNTNQLIVLESDQPLDVNFDNAASLPASFAFDANLQFTANVSVNAADEDLGEITFVWYLNGELLNMSSSYNFDSASSPQNATVNGMYLPGHYRVDVIAFNTEGSRAGSTQYEFDVTGNPTNIALPTIFGSVTGQVGTQVTIEDSSSFVPLMGAQILSGGRIAMTDAQGNFNLNFVADGAQVVQVVFDGYLSSFKPVTIVDQANTNTGQILLRSAETFNMDAATGGSYSMAENVATVNFPGNVIVDESGNPYSGAVTVNATAVDPASNDFFESFPGDFTGLTEGGDVVDIISFGAIAVELLDDNGGPLNIADGQSAEIRIAVADPVNAPATLPLWYLDENTGIWTEEGIATLIGNEYVGSVTHFSWWNFDARITDGPGGVYIRGQINGTVVDVNGDPVDNADVVLSSVAGMAWATQAQTNAAGEFIATVYVANSQSDPYYAVYARKDGVESMPIAVRVPNRAGNAPDITGVNLILSAPQIALTAQAANGQILANNGPLLRFGGETQMPVTLSNNGADGLEVTRVDITGTNASEFRLSRHNLESITVGGDGQRRGNMNNGDSELFIITYLSPGAASTVDAQLVITSANAPTMTVELEAGTPLNQTIEETVSINRADDHIGYVIEDNAANRYTINTSTETGAIFYEDVSDKQRILFAMDTAIIATGSQPVATVEEVILHVNSSSHNGFSLYQGRQGANLAAADFDPLNNTALSDSPIPTGDLNITLNQAAREAVLAVLQDNNATMMPFIVINNDSSLGSFNLTDINLIIRYTR